MRSLPIVLCTLAAAMAAPPQVDRTTALKADLAGQIDHMKDQAQVMVDTIFSFAELGFQEVETSKYLTGLLEKEGFRIERGVAGIPTSWVATWGSGKPVVALVLMSSIPQAFLKPGVVYHDPLIQGAPGHGEGHTRRGVEFPRGPGARRHGARAHAGHHQNRPGIPRNNRAPKPLRARRVSRMSISSSSLTSATTGGEPGAMAAG